MILSICIFTIGLFLLLFSVNEICRDSAGHGDDVSDPTDADPPLSAAAAA